MNQKVLERTEIIQLLELTEKRARVQSFETGYSMKRFLKSH